MRRRTRFFILTVVLLCTLAGAFASSPVGASARATSDIAADGSAAPNLTPRYLGGPMLQNPKLIGVLWNGWHYGSDVNIFGVAAFMRDIVVSPYITHDLNAAFGAPVGKPIGAGSLKGFYNIFPAASNDPATLGDGKIRTVLTNQINAGNLPGPGPDKLYVIFFPPGKTFSSQPNSCAYHSGYYYNSGPPSNAASNNLYYAVIPYEVRFCQMGGSNPGPSPNYNNLTFVTSHEIIEAITDPVAGSPAHGADGWYPEVADPCVGAQGFWASVPGGVPFIVTQFWSPTSPNQCQP